MFFLSDFIESMFCNVESGIISGFSYSSTKNLMTSDMLECSVSSCPGSSCALASFTFSISAVFDVIVFVTENALVW